MRSEQFEHVIAAAAEVLAAPAPAGVASANTSATSAQSGRGTWTIYT